MKLAETRVGYAGYSRDFSVPGDRRRFAAYARLKGVPIEYAELHRPYDLAYVTYSSDLPGWVARKRAEGDDFKLVFELIDAYFTQSGLVRRLLKGTARRLLGTESRFSPDLQRTLIDACSAADAVICSTEEQRDTIRRHNPNVFISFDHFGGELGRPKADYRRTGKLQIVWEGQSTTLPNLQVIREPLNDLRDKIELHVVTDPLIHRYFGRFSTYPAMKALDGIECEKYFHRWDRSTFSNHVTACDLAVIPIERSNALWWGKPENKLVLLWQLGMPVLTTATPVYRRVMEAAGVDMACATSADWGAQLEWLLKADGPKLEQIGGTCRAYAERAYSEAEFVRRFDQAFAAIGFSDVATSSR
jgi:glycosyltransferase involved in cell wall biosynthesis